MAYTSDQLATIESAIATGTLRVEVEGGVVQYQSMGELLRLRDLMRSELGVEVSSNARGHAWRPTTARGL